MADNKSGIASLSGWRKGMSDGHDAYDYASGGSIASGGPIGASEYPMSSTPSPSYSEALPYSHGYADGGEIPSDTVLEFRDMGGQNANIDDLRGFVSRNPGNFLSDMVGGQLARADSQAGNFGIAQWTPPAAGSYTAPALPNQTTYQDQYAADKAARPTSAGIDAYVNDLNRQFKAGPKYAANAGVPIGTSGIAGDTNTGTTGSSGTGAGGSGTNTEVQDTSGGAFTGDTGSTGAGPVTAVGPGFTVTPREREGLTTVEDVDTGENLLNTDTNYDANPTDTYPGADGTDTALTDAEFQAILDAGNTGVNADIAAGNTRFDSSVPTTYIDENGDVQSYFGDSTYDSNPTQTYTDANGNPVQLTDAEYQAILSSGTPANYDYTGTGMEDLARGAVSDQLRDQGLQDLTVDNNLFGDMPQHKELSTGFFDRVGNLMSSGEDATKSTIKAAFEAIPGAKTLEDIAAAFPKLARFVGGLLAGSIGVDAVKGMVDSSTARAAGTTGTTESTGTTPGAGNNGFVDLSQSNFDNLYTNQLTSDLANNHGDTSFLDSPTFWGSMQNSDNAANGRLATNFSSSSGVSPNFGMGANGYQFYSNGLNLQGGEPLSIYNPRPPASQEYLDSANSQSAGDTYSGPSADELMRQNMLMGANWTIGDPDAESFIQSMGGYAKGGDIHGGLGSLPEYKAGGILRGPGDGMSDDIPAVIKGPKPQRAALADGEFVIPADVVSHLGNGSTEAGSKRLYAMMDKVRHARTGNKKQGKQINPDKFLPA
jgi:hypothetical protein